MSLQLDGTNGITYNDGTQQSSAPVGKNLIINGDMRIHQRSGTITAASATVYYGLDRFWGYAGTGQFSMEQSTDAPDNFLNSMKVTVTTVDSSMAAGDRYMLSQPIEGLNVTNLDFGLSTAQTVTLSFWVKSSITGTFGAVLINGNATRTYVKEYTINAANTWEKKTITITGDTTGTWTYTNALWGSVRFCLAAGSTYHGTDSTWNAGNYISTSNQTNLMATSSATFYITAVQLEVGTEATPFENRMYSTELAMCQRYYYKSMQGTPANNIPTSDFLSSSGYNGYTMFTNTEGRSEYFQHPVQMRASPTVTIYSSNRANTAGKLAILIGSWVATTVSTPVADFNRLAFDITSPTSGVAGYSYLMAGGFDASAEL